jgi:hypothetical protein
MEKKKVAVETPVTAAGMTIIPITSTNVSYWHGWRSFSLAGLKSPFYLVVKNPQGIVKLFHIEGTEVTLAQITAEYPEIRETLEKVLEEIT